MDPTTAASAAASQQLANQQQQQNNQFSIGGNFGVVDNATNQQSMEMDVGQQQQQPSMFGGVNSGNTLSDTMQLPSELVGLIIGRGGENIMGMQKETGCRIQISASIAGTNERPCTLSGTQEQVEVCKSLIQEIISRSRTEQGNGGLPSSMGGGAPTSGSEITTDIQIQPNRCGLIVGKGGETIKTMQQQLNVKMHLIQDSSVNTGMSKPLRISGSQANVNQAINYVQQLINERDAIENNNGGGGAGGGSMGVGGPGGNSMFAGGDSGNKTVVSVPKAAVGVVIGKGGDMITQIQNNTGTRIQFKPETALSPERICTISGPSHGVEQAVAQITQIIKNVQERDARGSQMGVGGMGGSVGFDGGIKSIGGFEQWDNNGGGNVSMQEHLVPVDKVGLVIGKGGETIKEINRQSGARAEVVNESPKGLDPNYKIFYVRGTVEQISICRRLIQQKVDEQSPADRFATSRNQQPSMFDHQQQQQQQQQQQPQFNMAMQAPQQQQQQQLTNAGLQAAQQGLITAAAAAQQQQQQQQTQAPMYQQGGPTDYSAQWYEYFKNVQQNTAAAAAVGVQPQQLQAAAAVAGNFQQQQHQVAAQQQPQQQQVGAAATGQHDYSAEWAEYYRQLALQQQPQS